LSFAGQLPEQIREREREEQERERQIAEIKSFQERHSEHPSVTKSILHGEEFQQRMSVNAGCQSQKSEGQRVRSSRRLQITGTPRSKVFKRNLFVAVKKANTPGITQRKLCSYLDGAQEKDSSLALVRSWGKRTWIEAFDDPETKPLAEILLSKIKPARLS